MELSKHNNHINLRLSKELYEASVAAAEADHRTLSSWIRHVIADALNSQVRRKGK
jgi:predicted HicB family RNase H-like nuclease